MSRLRLMISVHSARDRMQIKLRAAMINSACHYFNTIINNNYKPVNPKPKYKQEIPNNSQEVLPFRKIKLISTIVLRVCLQECPSITKNHSFLLISSDGPSFNHTESIMLGKILKYQTKFSFTNRMRIERLLFLKLFSEVVTTV
jgi:hypothetical protein